jgi:hypothetical protein
VAHPTVHECSRTIVTFKSACCSAIARSTGPRPCVSNRLNRPTERLRAPTAGITNAARHDILAVLASNTTAALNHTFSEQLALGS